MLDPKMVLILYISEQEVVMCYVMSAEDDFMSIAILATPLSRARGPPWTRAPSSSNGSTVTIHHILRVIDVDFLYLEHSPLATAHRRGGHIPDTHPCAALASGSTFSH
jgi:hypothetical protein